MMLPYYAQIDFNDPANILLQDDFFIINLILRTKYFGYKVHVKLLCHKFTSNKVTQELTETLNSFHNKNPLQ